MVAQRIVVLLFLITAAFSTPAPKKLLADEVGYRLPTTVVPTKYTIQLTFPDTAFTADGNEFQGTATIEFTVTAAITELKFHVSDFITITELKVDETGLDPADYTIDLTTEILTIPTASLKAGNNYKVVITYTGTISTTDNYGIYKSSYPKNANEKTYFLTSQFEPTYARRAFPCFDEPSFKATFDVSVIYPSTSTLNVLFNTENTAPPVKDDTANTYTVTFKTTPVMSTYLVALTISDFTSTVGTSPTGDTVKYTAWSRNDLGDSRIYALGLAPTILQKLNEYTGRSYVTDMSKLDQVALPDLSSEAMENWGLVTYREKYLLWAQDTSSITSKQTVAMFVAHELAHQWFGNLITCNWWSETFLNEGFATYFQYLIPHQIEASWELDKQFVVDILQPVLESDSLEDSQALQSEVNSPLEVSDKFGQVSYDKGGSIVRMLTYIMGEENFKAGIQEYFKDTTGLIHGTSIPTQLWEILQKHVTQEYSVLPDTVTLTNVMENWVGKPGYPLLTVTLSGKTLKISQERFLLTGEDKETKWFVPITYVESESETKFEETKPSTWLTPTASEATITLENDNSWVLLNPLQTGFFRINYDTNLWTKISEALNEEDFSGIVDLNRAQIVDDLFNLAKAKKLAYSVVFNTIDFLKSDDSLYSWVSAFKGYSFMLERIPEGSELKTLLEAQVLTLIETFYKSVSFEEVKDTDQVYTLKQVLAFSWACALGKEDCVTKTKAAFSEYKSKGTKPNVNLQSVIYCSALKNSEDATDYEFLWTTFQTEVDTAIEPEVILNSLGCFNNEDKLKELLTETIKADSKIPTKDSLAAFAAVYSGSLKGVDVALDFLVANLKNILTKYSTTSSRKELIAGIAGKLTTSAQVLKLKNLVETSTDFPADLKEDGQKAVSKAEANNKWLTDHRAELETFFKGSGGGGASAIQVNMIMLAVVGVFSMLKFLAV